MYAMQFDYRYSNALIPSFIVDPSSYKKRNFIRT